METVGEKLAVNLAVGGQEIATHIQKCTPLLVRKTLQRLGHFIEFPTDARNIVGNLPVLARQDGNKDDSRL